MRLDKKSKVELVASTDAVRPDLLHPFLDVEAKVLVATDGTRLIKHPVVIDDGDETAFVSVAAIKAARKLAPKGEDLEIGVGAKTLRLTDGTVMPTPKSDLSFPPYDRVIPTYNSRTTVTVDLDVSLLLGLCQAMGGSPKDGTVVRLTFPLMENGDDMFDPIMVGYGGSDAIGILMPARPPK